MPKYEVTRYFSGFITVEVEADNKDEAYAETFGKIYETPYEEEFMTTLESMKCCDTIAELE